MIHIVCINKHNNNNDDNTKDNEHLQDVRPLQDLGRILTSVCANCDNKRNTNNTKYNNTTTNNNNDDNNKNNEDLYMSAQIVELLQRRESRRFAETAIFPYEMTKQVLRRFG